MVQWPGGESLGSYLKSQPKSHSRHS